MLFKSADISAFYDNKSAPGAKESAPHAERSASGISVNTKQHFATGEKLQFIERTIGELAPGHSVFFKTDEFLLMQSGPADVYFTTWSISEEAIVRLAEWQSQGVIRNLVAVLDAGIRNRKPEIYQQACGAFATLKVCHCHAKVTVIMNDHYQVTLMGSANYTRNPRIEAGSITWDKSLAEQNIAWIMEEVSK